MTPDQTIAAVPVKIEFPYEKGNEYQEKSCKFSYTVEAVQGNAKPASEWDGETVTEPTFNEEDGKYHITNAAEFVAYIKNTNTGNSYVLDRDIDLDGHTIDVSGGSRVCDSNFDGQNYTVSNFTLKGGMYTSLFGYMTINESGRTIENLIVRNATVIGGAQTSVILSAANKNDAAGAATVNNCKVYDSTIIGEKKVAPIVGYTESGTITNCYAENCTVYCADNRSEQAGEVVGYINLSGGHTDNTFNNTYKNVTVKHGYAFVSSFENLEEAIENGCSHVTLNTGVSNDTPPHDGGDNPYHPYQIKDQYTIKKGQELTIDLNGETYEASVRLFHVMDGGKLTITSSKPGGKITINTTDPDFNYAKDTYGMKVEKGGVLNIEENVTIEMNVTGVANPVALCLNNGTVNMNGGELIVYDSAVFSNYISNFGTFTMNGGKITLASKQANGSSTGFALWGSGVTANLNAGSIEGKGLAYNKATVTYFGESNVIVAEGFVINTTQGPNT